MNLILFRAGECTRPLRTGDPRARHVIEVLRRRPGDAFDCGLVDGPRGRAHLVSQDEDGLHLAFSWDSESPPSLLPITLLVGLPRPQTARKIIGEATTLGVAHLVFFSASRGERSYGDSTLWTSGEVERLTLAAAEQAFCTRLPRIERMASLGAVLSGRDQGPETRLALDNYEASCGLGAAKLSGAAALLAVGPERGWSDADRMSLRDAGFTLAHLGPRVLRTETACTAGVAVLKTRLGLW